MGRAIIVALVVFSIGCRKHEKPEEPVARAPLPPGTADIADLVARVEPAVVNITSMKEIRHFDDWDFPTLPFGAPSKKKGDDDDHELRRQSLGSGFIIDDRGHVVTNAHVIDDADLVKVKLSDGRELEAKVRGKDDRLDVAVLEIHAGDLPHVTLGSSDKTRVGEYIVTMGNPFGLGQTVTFGIVSGKDRALGAGPYDDFIQTDASINPGNSGGPIFDMRGDVIGIATAMNPNGQGIGFATPIDAVKDILPQLLEKGHVTRGKLGVVIQPVTPPIARAAGLDPPRGAFVSSVEPKGAGQRAGLRSGDIIVSVEGKRVARSLDLPRLVARHPPGAKLGITIVRGVTEKTMSVSLDPLAD